MAREYLLLSPTNRRKVHPRLNLRNLQRFRLPKTQKQIRSKADRKSLRVQQKRNLKVKLNSKNLANKK